MQSGLRKLSIAAIILMGGYMGVASAKLPPLTPEQQKAADAKKAQAAADAEMQKQQLEASMDKVANRWRARAQQQGWQTGSGSSGSSDSASAAGGQLKVPQQAVGRLGGEAASQSLPIRSEKLGTAPRSEDAKNPAEKGK